jgi:uncharacterized membrane protein
MKASDFFNTQQQTDIIQAIKEAELNTSGEIRVHIDVKCSGNVLDKASDVFAQLKMHKTEQRNGVLFYLAVCDKQYAVIGDAGINKVVPADFWDSVKNVMHDYFIQGQFSQGLVKGILMAGEKLKANFPYQHNDVNELPDEISFGTK